MVITALTRNQVYRQRYRGFESHPLRQKKPIHPDGLFSGIMTLARVGFERRLLAACRWHAATAVAFPQKRDPTRSASSSRTTQVRDDFFMLRMKKSSLTCSVAPRCKIVTALLGHDFVFAAGTGRDVHEKSPSGWMGFFRAAARVGEDEAEIRRRSVYTDAASWSRKSWMTSNRWTGSSCWVVQSFARRSTAARSSEKGEMTARVVQQPLCRCWPRRP